MAVQFSLAVRTYKAGAVQVISGTGSTLAFFTGALPFSCASANPSGRLVTIALPATFLTASAGTSSLIGAWAGTASAGGIPACYRIFDSGGVCHEQGDAASFSFTPASFSTSQAVTITVHTGVEGGN